MPAAHQPPPANRQAIEREEAYEIGRGWVCWNDARLDSWARIEDCGGAHAPEEVETHLSPFPAPDTNRTARLRAETP